MRKKYIIGFPHPPQKEGGPGSFQKRIEKELINLGFIIRYSGDNVKFDLIIVIGGTKKLWWLLKNKLIGVKIIHRLDGINWLHKKKKYSIKYWLYSELTNWLVKIIRNYFADFIIYQSKFSQKVWEAYAKPIPINSTIIYNGVDRKLFKKNDDLQSRKSLICVEGNLDYSPYSIQLINILYDELFDLIDFNLYGSFENKINLSKLNSGIRYHGYLSQNKLINVYNNAILLSLDINPACPNSVIEALASGIPVVGYDTGSLNELVHPKAGIIVSYNDDLWNTELPDVKPLIKAIKDVIDDWPNYSLNAHKISVNKFDINKIAKQYSKIIIKQLSSNT